MSHYLWQSIWAGHIHAIRGKHLSRTRRKSEDASRAKSSDPWLFHNWELRPPIQLSSFALCDIRLIVIFLEHLHGLVLCENDSTNQTVRTGTLGKSRQMKPKLWTLWGWYLTKMASAFYQGCTPTMAVASRWRGLAWYRFLWEIFLMSAAEPSRLRSPRLRTKKGLNKEWTHSGTT